MMTSLYAHGMSVRDAICPLRHAYGTGLSPGTVSRITGHVLEEVKAWQPGPMDPAARWRSPARSWSGSPGRRWRAGPLIRSGNANHLKR